MAKLGGLIQGQDVAFDTHQSGDGQPVHWKELHLEKRLHKGGKIRFPFFGDRKPSSSDGLSDKDYERVVKEVSSTLKKNPRLQTELADTVLAQMDRFSAGQATIANATDAARKIAAVFDLGENFVASTVTRAGKKLTSFTTLHPGKRPGTVVEIVQSSQRIEVRQPTDSWPQWRGDAL